MSTARAARARRLDAPDEVGTRGRRTHLTVVDEPRPTPKRSKAPVLAAVVALVTVFLALFGLVVFHTVLVQNQSQIDGLDDQLTAEREQIKETRLEIAELEAPDRVIAVAESQGLIPPDEVVMLDAVVPTDAGPAPAPAGPPAPVQGHQSGAHQQAGAAPGDTGATP
jgi:cell division protein FtsL